MPRGHHGAQIATGDHARVHAPVTFLTDAFSKKLDDHYHEAGAVFRVVQFRVQPQDAPGVTSDGNEADGSALGDGRHRAAIGRI